MGNLRKKLIVFTLMLFSVFTLFTACSANKYKNMKLEVKTSTDLEIVLQDEPQDNVFFIDVEVSKRPKGYNGAVTFTIPVNEFITVVEDCPEVKNGVSRGVFRATQQGGPIDIAVKTNEGNLEKKITVKVVKPITSLTFTSSTIPVVKGVRTDISSFINFKPEGTEQKDITLEVSSNSASSELSKIVVDGKYLTVPSDCDLTSFNLTARSSVNTQLVSQIVEVKVINHISQKEISLVYDNGTSDKADDIVLERNNLGEYEITLATNTSNFYSKTVYFKFGNDETSNYKVTVAGRQSDGSIILPGNVYNNVVHVDETLNALNSFDITAIGNGKTSIEFNISRSDFADYEQFNYTIKLNVNSVAFPKEIVLTNGLNDSALDSIHLYPNYNEDSNVFGTRFRVSVFNETGLMTNENIIFTLSYGEENIQIYDRFKNLIPLGEALSTNQDYYLAHNFSVAPLNPINLIVTSATFGETFATIPVVIDTAQLVLTTNKPNVNLDLSTGQSTSLEINGVTGETYKSLEVQIITKLSNNQEVIQSVFDKEVVSTDLVMIDRQSSSTQVKVSTNAVIGVCTIRVIAENGSTLDFIVTVFESIVTENSYITIAGEKINAKDDVGGNIPSITVKNGLTIPVIYTINGVTYDNMDYTGLVSSITSNNTSVVKRPSDYSIQTQNIADSATITISVLGFNSNGVQNKYIYFQVQINVTIPFTSLTTNLPEVTRYDVNTLSTNLVAQYGKYDINLITTPYNATFDYQQYLVDHPEGIWSCEINNNKVPLSSSNQLPVITGDTITYEFIYNNVNRIVLTTTKSNYKSAEVRCYIGESSRDTLYFKIIAKIEQSFRNEAGVLVVSPKETSVRMIIKKAEKVSNFVFGNVRTYSENGTPYYQVAYDERDVDYDDKTTTIKEIPFTVYPSTALNKNLAVTTNSSDIEATIDNVNHKLIIRILNTLSNPNNTKVIVYPVDTTEGNNYSNSKEIYVKLLDGKTKSTAFEIANENDLIRVNSKLDAYYKLVNNINLSSNWTPIGYQNGTVKKFMGNFSGRDIEYANDGTTILQDSYYTISGLNINNNKLDYYGLFAYVGHTAHISDLTIRNFIINVDIDREVNIYAGALAGYLDGYVDNVIVNDGDSVSTFTGDYYNTIEKGNAKHGIYITSSTTTIQHAYLFVGGMVGFSNNVYAMTNDPSAEVNINTYYNSNSAINSSDSIFKGYKTLYSDGKYVDAQLSNVKSSVSINVYERTNNVTYVGGLVGFNNRSYIHNSDSDSISFGSDSADVFTSINASLRNTQQNHNENSAFGGVVGFNNGTIEGVIAKTDIIGNYVSDNKNTLAKMSNIGGIAGYNTGSVIDNTVYPLLRGNTNIGGIVGNSNTAIVHIDNTLNINGQDKIFSFVNGVDNRYGEISTSSLDTSQTLLFNKNFAVNIENFESITLNYDQLVKIVRQEYTAGSDDVAKSVIDTMYAKKDNYTITKITYTNTLNNNVSHLDYYFNKVYNSTLPASLNTVIDGINYNNKFYTASYFKSDYTLQHKLSIAGINIINDNKVQFLNLENKDREYNTAIIGNNNVGGVVGQYSTLVEVNEERNFYYEEDSSTSTSIGVTDDFTIYNPINYNSVYSYSKSQVVPYNNASFDDGYYGDIMLYFAFGSSLDISNRNYAGGIVGRLNNGAVANSQVFADIQGNLAGIGGIIGQVEGVIQVDSVSFIGNLYNIDQSNDIDCATGGFVGDARLATTTYAHFGQYDSATNTFNDNIYAGSKISVVQQVYNGLMVSGYDKDSNSATYDHINNITNSYFIAYDTTKNTLNYIANDSTIGNTNGFVGDDTIEIEHNYFTIDGSGSEDNVLDYVDENGDPIVHTISKSTISVNNGSLYYSKTHDSAGNLVDFEGIKEKIYSFTTLTNTLDTNNLQEFMSNLSIYQVSNLENDNDGNGILDIHQGSSSDIQFRSNHLDSRPSNWYSNPQVNNGLPVLLSKNKVKLISKTQIGNTDAFNYTYRIDLMINFPPEKILVDSIGNYIDTFIENIDEEKVVVLSYFELSENCYDSTGMNINFQISSDYGQSAINTLTNNLTSQIRSLNTYALTDILSVSTIPSFIDGNSFKVTTSDNNILSFDLDDFGNVKFIAKSSGVVTVTIASAYDKSKFVEVTVNVVNAVKDASITYNESGESKEVNVDNQITISRTISTSPSNIGLNAKLNYQYEFTNNALNVHQNFDFTNNTNGGIRYYLTHKEGLRYSVYFDSDPTSDLDITINSSRLTCEQVGDRYVAYYDVPITMEARFSSTKVESVDFITVPYINIYNADNESVAMPLVKFEDTDDYLNLGRISVIGLSVPQLSNLLLVDGARNYSDVNNNNVYINNYTNFVKGLIKKFTINVVNSNWELKSSLNSVNIDVDYETMFKVDIKTDKPDEKLYLSFIDNDGYERKICIDTIENKLDSEITISNITLRYTDKNIVKTGETNTITYNFSVYVKDDNKINVEESITKTFTFFAVKDNTELILDSSELYIRNDLVDIMDSKLKVNIPVTVNPQPINDIILRHYPNSEVTVTTDANGNKISSINLNEIAYDNIIPGHVGVLKIYVSPEYSSYDRIEITSSVSNNFVVTFEQLLAKANENDFGIVYSGSYQTLISSDNNIVNGIKLSKQSYINQNDIVKYNGYIYVRTLINSFVTEVDHFTFTVNAYDKNSTLLKSKSIDLKVQTPPSLVMTIDGDNQGVVARGTETEFDVSFNGYEGNVDFSDSYMYRINVNGLEEVVSTINSTFAVKVVNNKYYVVTNLNLSLIYRIRLIGKISKNINGEIITSSSEIDLKIADFMVEEITVDYLTDGYFTGLFNQPYKLIIRVNKATYNSNIEDLVKEKIKLLEASLSSVVYSDSENKVLQNWRVVDSSISNIADGRYKDKSITFGANIEKTFVISSAFDSELNTNVFTLQNTKFNSGDVLAAVVKFTYTSDGVVALNSENINDYSAFIYEKSVEFGFNFYRFRDEDHPEPISSVEEFRKIETEGDGVDYILTSDITLRNWVPFSENTKINSLDGNGYVIKLESFQLEDYTEGMTLLDSVNIGIFEKINAGTIIKNLIIEIAPVNTSDQVEYASYNKSSVDLFVDARAYKNVNFGILAAENAGIITNVQIVNNANDLRKERENMIASYDSNYEINYTETQIPYGRNLSVVRVETANTTEVQTNYMAGLVGRNYDEGEDKIGTITNSSIDNISISGAGYVSGFVAENNGKISTSYFNGGNVINRVAENYAEGATSGFVVFNNGENAAIQYSYVQGILGEAWIATGQSATNNPGEVSLDRTGLSRDVKENFAGYKYAHEYETNKSVKLNYVQLRALNSMVTAKTNASAFIYENDGIINNSYANILVNSVMNSSGFVFHNKSKGTISSSYTLSSIKLNDYNASPFTGRSEQSKYNNENPTGFTETHYLKLGSDTEFATAEEKKYSEEFLDSDELATSLGASQFTEYNTFQGYAFNTDFESNSEDKVTRAVWFIPNTTFISTCITNKNHFKRNNYASGRPELTAANLRTVSVRVWTGTDDALENNYYYVSDTIGGSVHNPLLITTAEQFNGYLNYDSGVDVKDRNFAIRFISDIAFNKTDLRATTYTMDYSGDLDGNGMTISNLRLISDSDFESGSDENEIDYLGLFGRIVTEPIDAENSQRGVVRNINIVVDEVKGTKVTYVGVLAGVIENGDAFNIDIKGSTEKVYLKGRNFAGGLAGLVAGDSEIVNITSAVNVTAEYVTSSNIYSKDYTVLTKCGNFNILRGKNDVNIEEGEEDQYKDMTTVINPKELSYAGGVVGAIDADERDEGGINLLSLFNSKARNIKTVGNVKIQGEIVGGVLGFLGRHSTASDVKFIINENETPKLSGSRVSGGLIGESRGSLERSYIQYIDTLQKSIDEEYQKAASVTTKNAMIYSSNKNYNEMFVSNAHYIGGVVGLNIGGSIENCYSRINVLNINSAYAGGLVGASIGGKFNFCYTTGSVLAYKTVGGFIGVVVSPVTGEGIDSEKEIKNTLMLINFNDTQTSVGEGGKEASTMSIIQNAIQQRIAITNCNSINIWRKSDLTDNREVYGGTRAYIGAFIGNIEACNAGADVQVSSVLEVSVEGETYNYFIQPDISHKPNKKAEFTIRMPEIGAVNSVYAIDTDREKTDNTKYEDIYIKLFSDDVRASTADEKESSDEISSSEINWQVDDKLDSHLSLNETRLYGITGYSVTEDTSNRVKSEEENSKVIYDGKEMQVYNNGYYVYTRYSRKQNIGSARTYKEFINDLKINIDEETEFLKTVFPNSKYLKYPDTWELPDIPDDYITNTEDGRKYFVVANDSTGHDIIVKMSSRIDDVYVFNTWSKTRWTGIRKETAEDLLTVFPYLQSKPENTKIYVTTPDQLLLMQDNLNAEFILRADIDMRGINWKPVGSVTSPFRGLVHSDPDAKDGDGNSLTYTIKNLSIEASDENYLGMIGYASGAQLYDFNIENWNLNGPNISTPLFMGSLVAFSNTGTIIRNINADGIRLTTSNAGTMGGLIGYSGYGEITDVSLTNVRINIDGIGNTAVAGGNIDKLLAFGGVAGMMSSLLDSVPMIGNATFDGTINFGSKTVSDGSTTIKYVNFGESNLASNGILCIGGILGRSNLATDSSAATARLINVNVNNKFDINLDFAKDVNNSVDSISIGGVVGDANNTTLITDSESINNVYAKDTNNITINNFSNAINYGGAIGYARGVTDTGLSTGVYKNDALYNTYVQDKVDFNINNCKGAINIGGGAGLLQNGPVSEVNTLFNATINIQNHVVTNASDDALNVGGIIGYADGTQNINRGYTSGTINIAIKDSNKKGVTSIGGAFGKVGMAQSNIEKYTISNVVADNNLSITFSTNGYNKFNLGGFIGYLKVGGINECVATTSVDVADINLNSANNVGGFVGAIDLNSTAFNKNIFVTNSYSSNDLQLGNIRDTDKAGLFIGNISVTYSFEGAALSKLELFSNYTISKFVYNSNEDFYQEKDRKGGFIGYISTSVDKSRYTDFVRGEEYNVNKLVSLVFANNYYNKDFIPYSNTYIDGSTTKEMLFNSKNYFESSNLPNNYFADSDIWTINNYAYPVLSWIDSAKTYRIAGREIFTVQSVGSKVKPIGYSGTIESNKSYFVISPVSSSIGDLNNNTIYFNSSVSVSSNLFGTIDENSLVYGIYSQDNTDYLITTNNGIVVNSAVTRSLVQENNGVVYQVSILQDDTNSGYLIDTNNGILDSVIGDKSVNALTNYNNGYIYRCVAKNGIKLNSNSSSNKIRASYVVDDSEHTYKYFDYDGQYCNIKLTFNGDKASEITYNYGDTDDKSITNLYSGKFELDNLMYPGTGAFVKSFYANVLNKDVFDFANDFTLINSNSDSTINYGLPILQYELKEVSSDGIVDFYGDIKDEWYWVNDPSFGDIYAESSKIERNKNISTPQDLARLAYLTTVGQNISETYSIATNGSLYFNDYSTHFEDLAQYQYIERIHVYETNFGVTKFTVKDVANFKGTTLFTQIDNIDLSGKLWTPIGSGYDNCLTSNINTHYQNSIDTTFNSFYDGSDYYIKNISSIGINTNVGLFGTIKADNTTMTYLQNILIKDSNFISIEDNGYAVAGALAGRIIVDNTEEVNLLTKSATESSDVYASDVASGLIGEIYDITTKASTPIILKYAYVNSDVYSTSTGFASAFVNLGNSKYYSSSDNKNIVQMYIAGNIGTYSGAFNFFTSCKSIATTAGSNAGLFGKNTNNRYSTIESNSIYAVGFTDGSYNKSITTTYLRETDLDYFTWGDVWTRMTDQNNNYPVLYTKVDYWILNAQVPKTITSDVIEINSASELAYIAWGINKGGRTNTYLNNKIIKLVKDIDLGGKIWTSIGRYGEYSYGGVGMFDFNGHSIRNIISSGIYLPLRYGVGVTNINYETPSYENENIMFESSDYSGLFGYTSNATITSTADRVGTIGSSLGDQSHIMGIRDVGALVAYAKDTKISNIENYALVTSSYSGDELTSVRGTGIGGIVGQYYRENTNSDKNIIENVHNRNNVTASRCNVGGIVGYATGANVFDLYINQCSNSGLVTATANNTLGEYVGGIVGKVGTCNLKINGINNKVNNIEDNSGVISGYKYVGGIVGAVAKDGSSVVNIENVTNAREVVCRGKEGYVGGIIGYIEGSETHGISRVTEAINKGKINNLSSTNISGGGLVGRAENQYVEFVNLLNKGQVINAYPIAGYLHKDCKIFSAIDVTTTSPDSVLLQLGDTEFKSSGNSSNPIAVVNLDSLKTYKTDISYDGKEYVPYTQVFGESLIWKVKCNLSTWKQLTSTWLDASTNANNYINGNSELYDIDIDYTILPSGSEPEIVDGIYNVKSADHLKYLQNLNRKRYGLSSINGGIIIVQNIEVENHEPLGVGAYPWSSEINGNNKLITIISVDKKSVTRSVFGSVMSKGQKIYIQNITIEYRVGNIDVDSGLFIDTGKNLYLKNITIKSPNDLTVSNSICFGTLAQQLFNSSLENVVNKQNFTIDDCQKSYVGGLVGIMNNCETIPQNTKDNKQISISNEGNITTKNNDYVGGIVGKIENMSLSYAISKGNINYSGTGAIVGGIVGFVSDDNKYTISSCEFTGEITASGENGDCVGGIVGKSKGYRYDSNIYGVYNVSSGSLQSRDGIVNGKHAGGIIGYSENDTIERCSSRGTVKGSNGNGNSYAGGIVGTSSNSKIISCDNQAFATGYNAGGIAGQLTNGSVMDKCINSNGEAVGGYNGDAGNAGGFAAIIKDSTIKGSTNKGYAAAFQLSTNIKVGGFVAYAQNSTISDCRLEKAYVGIRGNEDGYYYSVYNTDNNSGSGDTYKFSKNPWNCERAKKDLPGNIPIAIYVNSQSNSNISRDESSELNSLLSKQLVVYDEYIYCSSWEGSFLGIGGGRSVTIQAKERSGRPNWTGSFNFGGSYNKDNKAYLEWGIGWFVGYAENSTTLNYADSSRSAKTFKANQDSSVTYVINYMVDGVLLNDERYANPSYYNAGDSLDLPHIYGKGTYENKEIKYWHTDSACTNKISSDTHISNDTFNWENTSSSVKTYTIYSAWDWMELKVNLLYRYNPKFVETREEKIDGKKITVSVFEEIIAHAEDPISKKEYPENYTIKYNSTLGDNYNLGFKYYKYGDQLQIFDGWYPMSVQDWNYLVSLAKESTSGMGVTDEQKEAIRNARTKLSQYGDYKDFDNVDENYTNIASSGFYNTKITSTTKITFNNMYSGWINAYTVSFNGMMVSSSKDYYVGEGRTIGSEVSDNDKTSILNPTSESYIFTGWKNTSDGKIYTSSQINTILNMSVTKDITFEAQWKAKKYRIYLYSDNTFNDLVTYVDAIYDETLPKDFLSKYLPSGYDFTKVGYDYKGWFVKSAYSTIPDVAFLGSDPMLGGMNSEGTQGKESSIRTNYNTCTRSDSSIGEDIYGYVRMYVAYTETKYEVIFDKEDGSIHTAIRDKYIYGDTADKYIDSSSLPTKPNAHIKYWYVKGTDPSVESNQIQLDTYQITSSVELIPVYEYDNLTITYIFLDQDKTELTTVTDNSTYRYYDNFTRPSDMTLSGYKFDNFYTNQNLDTPYTFGNTITSNTTVYVKFFKQYTFVLHIDKETYALTDDCPETIEITIDYDTKLSESQYASFLPSSTDVYTQPGVTSLWLRDVNDKTTDMFDTPTTSIEGLNSTNDRLDLYYYAEIDVHYESIQSDSELQILASSLGTITIPYGTNVPDRPSVDTSGIEGYRFDDFYEDEEGKIKYIFGSSETSTKQNIIYINFIKTVKITFKHDTTVSGDLSNESVNDSNATTDKQKTIVLDINAHIPAYSSTDPNTLLGFNSGVEIVWSIDGGAFMSTEDLLNQEITSDCIITYKFADTNA